MDSEFECEVELKALLLTTEEVKLSKENCFEKPEGKGMTSLLASEWK